MRYNFVIFSRNIPEKKLANIISMVYTSKCCDVGQKKPRRAMTREVAAEKMRVIHAERCPVHENGRQRSLYVNIPGAF